MKYLFICLLSMGLTHPTASLLSPLADCEVLLESIAGEYEGDCKKGLAHGQGTSVGKDTYTGGFKKGLPDGTGVYTFANGDVYEGNFDNGRMDGKGKKTYADIDLVQEGNFYDGEFIGDEEKPYVTDNKTVSISRITYRRMDQLGNHITFKYTRQGKPVKVRGFSLQGSFGVMESQTDFENYVSVHEFPFKGGITFSALTTRSTSGNIGTGDWIDANLEFRLLLQGDWEVEIEMAGTE